MMNFEFSNKDRTITVHHFNHAGVYLSSNDVLIEANTGLPANSTIMALPEVMANQVAIYLDGQWIAKADNRGRIAYAKTRDSAENFTITDFNDIPDSHTLDEPGAFDSWTDAGWQYDIEQEQPIKTIEERNWRDVELASVLSRIDQYEKDKNYPQALRTSPIKAEADFLLLLNDRKVLSDYPNRKDFPFCDRPTLSGLVSMTEIKV